MTTVHPVRPAMTADPDADAEGGRPRGVLPGAELLADLLAGTEEEERPVTHVHHVPVRESSTLPWP